MRSARVQSKRSCMTLNCKRDCKRRSSSDNIIPALECQNQKTAAQRPSGVLLPIVRLLKVRIVHLYADVLSLTVR
jgi:hypothetical protein